MESSTKKVTNKELDKQIKELKLFIQVGDSNKERKWERIAREFLSSQEKLSTNNYEIYFFYKIL